jgi:radical SAM protein with 4Fe4S-binding SPASM domain
MRQRSCAIAKLENLDMTAIEITTRIGCKNGCAYCPQDLLSVAYTKRSREFMMSFEAFREFLDKIPMEVDIHFSGMCEPWLNPECTKMVRYAHATGHKLRIYTSIVGIKPSDVEELKSISFRTFVVHLPSSQRYEKITVDDGYLATLRCLERSGMVTSWLCHSNTVHPLITPLIGGKISYFPLITRAGNVQVEKSKMPVKRTGPIRCQRKLRQNVLLPNGDVLLCCMDYGMKHILGNLREKDYESLFTSEEFLLVQSGLEDPSLDTLCRTCDYFALKRGILAKLRSTLHANVCRLLE